MTDFQSFTLFMVTFPQTFGHWKNCNFFEANKKKQQTKKDLLIWDDICFWMWKISCRCCCDSHRHTESHACSPGIPKHWNPCLAVFRPAGWNQGAEDQEPQTQRLFRLHVPGVRSQRVQHRRQVCHLQAHKCHKYVSSPHSARTHGCLKCLSVCTHAWQLSCFDL